MDEAVPNVESGMPTSLNSTQWLPAIDIFACGATDNVI
jgi:hypothetical protein